MNVTPKALEKSSDDSPRELSEGQRSVFIEQYKLLFAVVVNLNDNVIKSMLTMFGIYAGTTVVALQNPKLKDLLLGNYVLITFFVLYLYYMRGRIKLMFGLMAEIENEGGFPYKGIQRYRDMKPQKTVPTLALVVGASGTLVAINTVLVILGR